MTTAVAEEIIETETIEDDKDRIAFRRACAYFKGFVVGYAASRGMKWDGDPDRTPEFREGWKQSQWASAADVTFIHVVYNRLRHERPHLRDAATDEYCVENYGFWRTEKVLTALEGLGWKGVL